MNERLYDCRVTIAGTPQPAQHFVWAADAKDAKAKIAKAAVEQNVCVVKVTAKRSF
jgi:hypothetical protein